MGDQPVSKRRREVSWNVIMSHLPLKMQWSESTVATFEKLENLENFFVFVKMSYDVMKIVLVGVLGENNDLVPIILEIKQKVWRTRICYYLKNSNC